MSPGALNVAQTVGDQAYLMGKGVLLCGPAWVVEATLQTQWITASLVCAQSSVLAPGRQLLLCQPHTLHRCTLPPEGGLWLTLPGTTSKRLLAAQPCAGAQLTLLLPPSLPLSSSTPPA